MSDDKADAGVAAANLVRVTGKLDVVASKAFEAELLAKLDSPEPVLFVDFADCAYVSSAGLRAVLIAAKTAKRGDHRLILAGMNPIVREVFKVSGFDRMLVIEDDLATAVAAHG
ncbi:MAG: STAS domain-containing protein [Geminicoccaceae bacterium]